MPGSFAVLIKGWERDRLPLSKGVGIFRSLANVLGPRIERQSSMDVKVTEEGNLFVAALRADCSGLAVGQFIVTR